VCVGPKTMRSRARFRSRTGDIRPTADGGLLISSGFPEPIIIIIIIIVTRGNADGRASPPPYRGGIHRTGAAIMAAPGKTLANSEVDRCPGRTATTRRAPTVEVYYVYYAIRPRERTIGLKTADNGRHEPPPTLWCVASRGFRYITMSSLLYLLLYIVCLYIYYNTVVVVVTR